ncbi:large ribosomal subunit protein mL48 [Cloeon dipterum]|uniref:large ribosomal subunit protein mL48 n=1 Tax=Cloeon dipterum TaxID=197152 RepID=UPI00321FEB5F
MQSSVLRRTLLGILKKPGPTLCCSRRNNTNYTIGGLWEPEYLEAMKSKVPLYDTLNIQMKGYDYPLLESYQKFVHTIASNMDIDVEECWATPPQNFKINTFKPNSTVLDKEFKLSLYERNVQIVDMPTTLYPILLSALSASVPEGVTVTVHEHDPEHEEVRYIPDLELKDLKDQLTLMGGPRVEKKKRKK